MNLFFSDKPGSHERHLRRKVNNPLFGDLAFTQEDVLQARARDEQELTAFMENFHAIAKDASELDANVDAEVLIELKGRLEKNYETSCCVMGSQVEIQQGLTRLIDSIMTSLLHASQEEEDAYHKLLEEKAAREIHFELLNFPLIADLLRSDSPIQSNELMPALLSEQEKVVLASTQLFTDDQLAFICEHGNSMLADVDSDHDRIGHARKMLRLLESARDAANMEPTSSANSGLAS